MFELRRVSKIYDETPALSDVNLAIRSGETTALIGPSGSGKSTLLRLMIGLTAPDRGTVFFDRVDLAASDLLKVRTRMGYVIQDGGLFPHLTARQNIVLMAEHLGWDPVRREHRVEELAMLSDFPLDGLERFPSQLSGGQRQRVSLMRALMLDPDVLLLDEPLGALDPMIRVGLQAELSAIFERVAKTVVLVTHDISEAGFFASHLVLMNEGRIAQSGSLRELVHEPASDFVAAFINAQRSPLESLA